MQSQPGQGRVPQEGAGGEAGQRAAGEERTAAPDLIREFES